MTKHFEEIWQQAETVSAATPTDKLTLFNQIKYEIDEYAKLDNVQSNDIQHILKTKKLGEVLFKVAELSRIDNINTYEALQLEIQVVSKAQNIV